MNKYQRQRSKEIKALMVKDKFGRITYAQARRKWNFLRLLRQLGQRERPCFDCDASCDRPHKIIAYCPRQR